jgi:transcriptional regulator with XRE-family HTH domain
MSDTGHSGQRRRRAGKINGERIRELRFRRGWTQQELAAAAELSPRTIEYAEAGKRVSPPTITSIAEALGVRVESLIGGKNDLQDQGFSIHRTDESPATNQESQKERPIIVQIVVDRDIEDMDSENIAEFLETIKKALKISGSIHIVKI